MNKILPNRAVLIYLSFRRASIGFAETRSWSRYFFQEFATNLAATLICTFGKVICDATYLVKNLMQNIYIIIIIITHLKSQRPHTYCLVYIAAAGPYTERRRSRSTSTSSSNRIVTTHKHHGFDNVFMLAAQLAHACACSFVPQQHRGCKQGWKSAKTLTREKNERTLTA